MLAAEADLSKLRFPLMASPKLDGVRALVKDGVVLSRSLKPIPNKHVQKTFGRPELEGLDGELIVGSPTAEDVYRQTVSAVMRHEGEPDVMFYVFDRFTAVSPFYSYDTRYRLIKACHDLQKGVVAHEALHFQCLKDLEAFENTCLELGYEGLILRDPSSPYKFGRSTVKEGYLLKLKRFRDSEARILAVEELMHNANEATTNELGRTERSSHKANQVPMGTMGALFVEDIHTGQQFRVGTGFSAEERAWFWKYRDQLTGDTRAFIKYKFFPVGVKDLPRHPSYLGIRNPMDLG